jgi:hypothetical protein
MAKKPKSIEPGTPPISYTVGRARAAVAAYNRIAGAMAISVPGAQRLTAAAIVNGPLRGGDLDAYVVLLGYGYQHIDEGIDSPEIDRWLSDYLRPTARGGRGGKLLDFYAPIRDALIDCGVIEEATESGEQADPPGDRADSGA